MLVLDTAGNNDGKKQQMPAELTLIDVRMHPLDPHRIGPEGLYARLAGTFTTAVDEVILHPWYCELLDAVADDERRQN